MASAAELAAIFRLKDEFSDTSEKIERRLGGLEEHLGVGLTRAATVGAAGFAVIATAAAAATERAFALGEAFDASFDRIRIGTGRTGDELESLKSSFRSVAADVPSSFEAISKAITETNQRLDLTGATLEARSTQFLTLSRLAGGDLTENIRSGAKAFQEWKIATDDQGASLDKLFRAYQLTGESSSTLFQQLQQAGPTFRQLGLGFDESLSMLAKWDKEGVESERIIAALRVGVANLTESGLPVPETFRAITQQIHDLDDESAAVGLAIQVFGRRAGPELAEAIRAGRLSAGEFFDQIAHGSDTLEQAAKDTDDAAQRWAQMGNRIALAFEPAGNAAFDAANKVADHLTPAFEEWAREAAPLVAGSAEKVIGFLDGIGGSADNLVAKLLEVKRALNEGIGEPPSAPETSFGLPGPSGPDLSYLQDRYANLNLSGMPQRVADEIDSGTPAAQATVERSADEIISSFFGRIDELFATSLDTARLRQSLGSSGASIAAALQTAWEKPLDAAARATVASAEAAFEDELKRTFGPEKGAEMSNYLSGLVANALAGGAGSLQEGALNTYLQGLGTRVPAQQQSNREAEAARQQAERDAEAAQREAANKARQAAEAEIREAERLAQAHADLLRQYARTAEQLAPEIEAAYGQVGQRAFAALDDAFQEGASGGAGSGLARSLSELARAAKDVGIPEWRETWRQLVAVGQQAIEEGTPAAKQAALEMIQAVNDTIKQANALSPENFARELDTAGLATAMGSQGAAISEALAKGIEEGGRGNTQALARATEAMRVALFQNPNFGPAEAQAWWVQIQGEINSAIDDGSEEAQQHLREYLSGLNRTLQEAEIGKRASDEINAAIKNTADQITQAYGSRDQAIKQLYTNLAIQQFDRSQEQAEQNWINTYLADTQKYVDGEKAKVVANRERAQTERQELRETADLEKSYQDAREALLKKKDTTATASTGQFRAAGAEAQVVSPHQAPGDSIAQQLRDLDAQHVKDMANLTERQAQRRADHAEDVKWQGEDKAAYDLVNAVLTSAQTAAHQINQDWHDTYQLNVTIPRQVNELMTGTDEKVTKLNTDLGTLTDTVHERVTNELSRLEYLHTDTFPKIEAAADTAMDGLVADTEHWHDLIVDGLRLLGEATSGATGGTSTPDNLPPPPPPPELPVFEIQTSTPSSPSTPETLRPNAAFANTAAPVETTASRATASTPLAPVHVHVEVGGQQVQTFVVDAQREAERRGVVVRR